MFAKGLQNTHITADEYLNIELSSAIKHEFVAGQIYAMSGGSLPHNIIAGNLYLALKQHLKGGPCRAFILDVKIHITAADAFYYPNVVVSCEGFRGEHYLESPILIIEVLSPSTASFDRQRKRQDYQLLPSLREYVLVSQDSMYARVFQRDESAGGLWREGIFIDGSVISLSSVGLEIPIEQIYEDAWVSAA